MFIFKVKNSGSFSSHLDSVGCAPDQQSLRYTSTSSNSNTQYQNEFRNGEERGRVNRNSVNHHSSQASNLSGGDNQSDFHLRRQQSSSRDSMGATSRGNTMGDPRIRSRSRSR